MRLLVLSDLHLESTGLYQVPAGIDYDAVVLAGDVRTPGVSAVSWAADPSIFGGRPVVLVPGNHEFYGAEFGELLEAMRAAAAGTTVHVLSRDSVVLLGVRFVGAILWTDFALAVGNDRGPSDFYEDTDVARALAEANRFVTDFKLIRLADASIPRRRGDAVRERTLTAEDTLAMHWVDRDWLRRELDVGHPGPTVVVTHHAPHRRSVAPKYRSDWVTPAFVSDLPDSFFGGAPMWVSGRKEVVGAPVLWVHGHTHTTSDYPVGNCRIVSNPRGYRMGDGSFENGRFDAGLIVEVSVEGGSRARKEKS